MLNSNVDDFQKNLIKLKINNNFLNQSKELKKNLDKILLLNNKYLRLYSEFENFKKRNIKERKRIIDNSSKVILLKFISILEDFERALLSLGDDEFISIRNGINIIYTKFSDILSKEGVLRIIVNKGDDLDHEKHEVISQISIQDLKLKGKIVSIVENGYFFNKKVIKFTKVIIGV